MKKFILWTCAIVMVACTTTRKQSELTASGLKQSDFQTEVDGKRTDFHTERAGLRSGCQGVRSDQMADSDPSSDSEQHGKYHCNDDVPDSFRYFWRSIFKLSGYRYPDTEGELGNHVQWRNPVSDTAAMADDFPGAGDQYHDLFPELYRWRTERCVGSSN